MSGKAKIKDLCPEDKKKIGNLIKKLADEREQKEQLLFKLNNIGESQKKQKSLKDEIQVLDSEIRDLQSQYQSPNFKQLIFRNTESSIMPLISRRSSVGSPIKRDQDVQTSKVFSQKKTKSSSKKQLLMNKIAEFEKIVNRLNFSKTTDQSIQKITDRSESSINMSMMQGVYQRILNLESQIQHRQEDEIIMQSTQQTQQLNHQDEDDLIIQLLNSQDIHYDPSKKENSQQSTYSNSFYQLINNLDNQKTLKKELPKQTQDQYCRQVLQKYDNLIREINK
ncbi:hypothetical protein pb186bvf_020199 [Paramecium bursaria]